ncbi:NAD(P)-dependent oxidoreductase [Microbacterium marinilacus]|uniref:NAD(P)-dependent oxidoreductase n=2 Tax=Microbacterium marinilacus TaxID=415209 RepID=A0ABP7B9K3_9MICO
MGLGEAGRLYARGLAEAGADVTGYDPHVDVTGAGVAQYDRLQDCVDGADVVLSLVGARASVTAARDAAAGMTGHAVLADLNAAAPDTKHRVARAVQESGVGMADVAVLAPVPRAGHRTPLLASGEGAEAFAARMRPFGVPVDVAPGGVGDAARLKLLRAIFMKGLAAVTIEALEAGRALGAEDWLRGQIASELGSGGDALVERFVTGTRRHAERRAQEVGDALEMLAEAGAHDDVTRATHAWLRRILVEGD